MPLAVLVACVLAHPATVFAEYRLTDKAVAPLDGRIFGQFMERPSWGNEIGIESAVVPGTHRLRDDVLKKIKELHIPIIRFPSGTDNDYVEWTDMIDNAPGRVDPTRPITTGHQGGKVTNAFGYDEFLDLARDLQAQVILPVRFRDALLGLKDPDAEAKHAADLVAYVNGTGSDPYTLTRKKNGHAKPWNVPIFQVGNETWFFFDDLRKRYPADPWGRYVDVLEKFVDAIHAVDPKAKIIADGVERDLSVLIRKRLGDKVSYLADHFYAPWEMATFSLDGKPYPAEKLTPEEVWKGWVSVFPVDPATGQARINLNVFRDKPLHRYPVAVTEWNFNGWWTGETWRKGALDSSLARGISAAGMLHGLMRNGKDLQIACQSMAVGRAWGITSIHVWPDKPAQTYPTGMVVGLYSRYHGSKLLKLDEVAVPTFEQPFRVGGWGPYPKVQATDVLASGDGKAVFLHAINRSFDQPATVKFDLRGLAVSSFATQYTMTGRLRDAGDTDIASIVPRTVRTTKDGLTVILPARSVSVVKIDRR